MEHNYLVKEYDTGTELYQDVNNLQNEGYAKDGMYIFAHDSETSKELMYATDTNNIGIPGNGVIDTITNFFKDRGDELRNELQNLGFTQEEADRYEAKLDEGKILLIVKDDDNTGDTTLI
jgi:hypothetical protein